MITVQKSVDRTKMKQNNFIYLLIGLLIYLLLAPLASQWLPEYSDLIVDRDDLGNDLHTHYV